MPFHEKDSIRYYTFDLLDDAGVKHALFTRQGGVSPQPWSALNVGGTVGDELERVLENRLRSFRALGREPASMFDVWQVHSADVVAADAPRPANVPHPKADAILTDRPQVTLFMRFADCVPVLLYDPRHQAAGIAHAGWQGTIKRTAAAAVQAMHDRYGSSPEDLLAGIGPSIGVHHYEVGPEVVAQVQESFRSDAAGLLQTSNGAVQFDLWAANRLVLAQAGVRQIEIAGLCTACHLDDWYSHRAEQGRTGRFGVLMAAS